MIKTNTSYRVLGYSHRWYVIDTFKDYVLLENETYGDETFALVVHKDAKMENRSYKNVRTGESIILPTIIDKVFETYDDIETTLEDNGVI